MASFAAQAAIRVKWANLVEDGIEVPSEVSNKVTSVVGWLKQASLEVRAAGLRAVNKLATEAASSSNSMSSLHTLSQTDDEQKISGNVSEDTLSSCQLVILHYNDVYNVEPRINPEPVGGAARFLTAIKSFQHLQPLVLFSGDAFSPSMLSTFTKGEQMVPVLNAVGTHCAVLGNHDFDHGLEVLSQWVAKCDFPWLMSNVVDNETGRPLGEGRITHVLHWAGLTIGLIGLVEKEWLDTLATINPEEVTFLDFIEAGQKLAQQLRHEGCDYVIALTHMRTPNDLRLAEHCPDIDIVLGGHDHVYETNIVNGTYVIKSGTDFQQFSKITISFDQGSAKDVQVEAIDVTSSFAEDEELKQSLEQYTSIVEGKMDDVLGTFSVPLEGRFSIIRTQETNLGNWVCDVVLAATGADLVLLNSGTLRSDRVHPAGDFTMRDLVNVIPMRDPLCVLCLSGKEVVDILENGVSQYPKLEGRFPQVAGVSFAFDPAVASGKGRIDPQLIRIGDEYLCMDQSYRLATKSYLHGGCDGYNILKNAKVLVDEDECPELGMAIQNHFQAINMRLGRTRRQSKHRQSLVTLSRRHSLVKMLDPSDFDGPTPLRRSSTLDHHNNDQQATSSLSGTSSSISSNYHHHHHLTSPASGVIDSRPRLMRRASLEDLEQDTCALAPKNERRIIRLQTPEQKHELLLQRQRYEQNSVIPEVEDECSIQY